MEAQQVVVMRVEANLEDEKVRNEEYRAIVKKYEERHSEMEVSVQPYWVIKTWIFENIILAFARIMFLM